MSPEPELSAIVLCYRAEREVLRVIEPLNRALQGSGIDYELVLVANVDLGQPDSTAEFAREFASANAQQEITVLSKEKLGGMGWDMRSGLEAARGEYLVVIDGDAQNPVEDVLRLYEEMKRTGAQVGKGRRIARFDSLYRRLLTVAYNAIFRLLFRTKRLWDINGKPKGLTRSACRSLALESDDWFIDAEIMIKAHRQGMTVVELPVIFLANEERNSYVKPSAVWEFVVNLAHYARSRS